MQRKKKIALKKGKNAAPEKKKKIALNKKNKAAIRIQKEAALERVADQTPDMREELLGQIRAVAPEAFTEGRLDLEKLAQLTGDVAEGQPERFSFTWASASKIVAGCVAASCPQHELWNLTRKAAIAGSSHVAILEHGGP